MTTNMELLEQADRECVEALAMMDKLNLHEGMSDADLAEAERQINAINAKIEQAQIKLLTAMRDDTETLQ